jgi:two-component system cell cycle sensor histidine kinase/response regulator CckA
MKFLILDDSASDRELITHKLRREFPGTTFVEVGREDQLEQAIAEDGYDMVLTDYQMYWTDGIQILKIIKNRYPAVPVVMFTGTGSEEIAVEGMKAGLSNYVLKKHLDHLPFAIRESLEKERLRTQYEAAIEQLRMSEERYREIFEQGLTGIIIFTHQGKMLACNEAFARILGFSSTYEAMQSSARAFFPNEDTYRGFMELVKQEKRLEYHEAELRRSDGEMVYVVGNVTGDFDESGNLTEIKMYIFDNTERKKLEAQFVQAQKMESLGQLVSGIAHDFNNMLGGILGHTERSLSRISENHPLYESLMHTRGIAERAARMTRQLLAFSRRQVIEPRVVDLNEVIRDLLDFIGKILVDQIDIHFIPDAELATVYADPTQVEQVLMNLCINARDAMPHGGKLLIKTQVIVPDGAFHRRHPDIQTGQYVLLTVQDTGTGMDKKVLERAFEPFFTTKELGKGTGLGLAMVHGIIGQHNGVVEIDSKVGQGTTFTIYLPLVDRVPTLLNTGIKEVEPVIGGDETILVVEDDPDLRFLMAEVLQDYGYNVVSADDGAEGLRLFEQDPAAIALIVSDLVTPKMKGKELYDRVHEMSPATSFLFVSGYTADQISRNFVLDEGMHFLQKPFDLDELAARVREVLEGQKANASYHRAV